MRIAVFLPNWVGDVVMATPAINALWDGPSGVSLVAVGRPYVLDVVGGSPWFDRVVAAGRGNWFGAARALAELRCDLAVLFPNSFRTALTAWLGRIPRRVGYQRYYRKPLLTDPLPALTDARNRIVPSPVLDAYNRLVEHIGVPTTKRMRLFTTARDEAAADVIWRNFGLNQYPECIVLNPGAAFGASKHWPAEYFAELARRFVDERGSGVLVLCGPNERDSARRIVALSRRPAVNSLAEAELSLGLTKALVRRSDLLVTTDSGPRHFAAAFDRPVVTLFGPTHIAWTETYHPAEVQLQKKVPCGPCQLRTCPLDHRCMTELRPNEVYRAATRLLAGHREVRHAG